MGILKARILEWVSMPSSRRSSQPRDWTQVSCIAGGFFTNWAIREAHWLCSIKQSTNTKWTHSLKGFIQSILDWKYYDLKWTVTTGPASLLLVQLSNNHIKNPKQRHSHLPKCQSIKSKLKDHLSNGFKSTEMSYVQFSSDQSISYVQLFVTPWTAACQACLSIINSRSLLKLVFIELVMPSNHLILCHPLLLLPSFLSSIRVFSSESILHVSWPMYWSFSFSITPSNEYSEVISFRIDWLDLLAVQGTLKHLLQHHSSKASILWHSGFFVAQLLHPYMTTGKTIALTKWIFVSNVVALLFNTLSRFVIAFLPRSKCLLISWLQSPSAVILEAKKN